MPAGQPLVNTVRVDINGRVLADDMGALLTSAVVDSSLVDPDHFVLTFRDPDRVVVQKTGAKIGGKVGVKIVSDTYPGGEPLIIGAEITALEVEFSTAGSFTVIRGFDMSHRLQRGRRTKAFKNMTVADVVRKVASVAGVPVGMVEPTKGVHDHIVQANSTDWEMVRRLAAEVGYEVDVTEGKLNFRKPKTFATAPPPGTLAADLRPGQLVKGRNILELQASVSAADQVTKVEVRGWDPKTKKALVATKPAKATSAKAGMLPAALAAKFGTPVHVGVATPHMRQGDALDEATSLMTTITGGAAELHAMVVGDPKLKAGTAVSLALVGEPFDGSYRLTSARHVYDDLDGYRTHLQVSGWHARSLLDLTSGGLTGPAEDGLGDGVVTAIVTNVKDPELRCRVKLEFPWLSADYESDWARTVQPGAGKKRGAVVLPEVKDEVLVAFDQGDFRRPYVLGGLHNGLDKPLLGPALVGVDGKVNRRGFVSRAGHMLVFFDGIGKEGVAVMTGDKGMRISMNKTMMAIKITSSGQVFIKGAMNVNVESGLAMTLKAGTTMAIQAGVKLDIAAPIIGVKAQGPVQVEGLPILLN